MRSGAISPADHVSVVVCFFTLPGLHGFFTVKSYMYHYARMANVSLPKKDLDEKIDTLLKQLGLAEQKDTRVGDIFLKGLSGGQKRRLSVALEALTDPLNLFLDEPTSGLGMYHASPNRSNQCKIVLMMLSSYDEITYRC